MNDLYKPIQICMFSTASVVKFNLYNKMLGVPFKKYGCGLARRYLTPCILLNNFKLCIPTIY